MLPVDPCRAECGGVANMLMPSLPPAPPELPPLWLLLDSPAPERKGLRGEDLVPLSKSNVLLPLRPPPPRGVSPRPRPLLPLSPRLRELTPPSSSMPTGSGGAKGSELLPLV